MTLTDAELRLHSLRGAPVPPELRADLGAFTELPEAARARFWEALGPSLGEPVPPAVEAVLDAFCASTGAEGPTLARVVKAARFLVREASRHDVPSARLADDLAALFPADRGAAAVLAAGYDRAHEVVRRELAERAILDHGKVLIGVDWRVDTIGAVKGGARLGQPVVMLTLTYREGDRTERVTLQALPDTLAELGELARSLVR